MGMLLPGENVLDLRNILSYTSLPATNKSCDNKPSGFKVIWPSTSD